MNEPIHLQFRDARRTMPLTQYQLADLMGIWRCTISRWERGVQSHSIPDADHHARTLHHRLVVTLDGHIISDLLTLFPTLPGFRKARGLSQMDLARRMLTHRGAVANIELRIRAGKDVRLATVVPYLGGLGCMVGLAPAAVLKRAA